MILRWAAFTASLVCVQPTGRGWDIPWNLMASWGQGSGSLRTGLDTGGETEVGASGEGEQMVTEGEEARKELRVAQECGAWALRPRPPVGPSPLLPQRGWLYSPVCSEPSRPRGPVWTRGAQSSYPGLSLNAQVQQEGEERHGGDGGTPGEHVCV